MCELFLLPTAFGVVLVRRVTFLHRLNAEPGLSNNSKGCCQAIGNISRDAGDSMPSSIDVREASHKVTVLKKPRSYC